MNDPGAYRQFPRQAGGSCAGAASPAALWRVVTAIGGENRYYYLNPLWELRERLDTLVGGPGRRRRRPARETLRAGDVIDSWQVLAVEEERRLALLFGMRAPGTGVLEFRIAPLPAYGARLAVTAYWAPRGLPGLLYWHAMGPAHRVLFQGLTREICRRAAGEAGEPARSA